MSSRVAASLLPRPLCRQSVCPPLRQSEARSRTGPSAAYRCSVPWRTPSVCWSGPARAPPWKREARCGPPLGRGLAPPWGSLLVPSVAGGSGADSAAFKNVPYTKSASGAPRRALLQCAKCNMPWAAKLDSIQHCYYSCSLGALCQSEESRPMHVACCRSMVNGSVPEMKAPWVAYGGTGGQARMFIVRRMAQALVTSP